jgi:DNA-binding IclR family transcriptional regulator
MDSQMWAVAAPVFDLTGSARAALTIVAALPAQKGTAERDALRTATLAAAAEISTELGAERDLTNQQLRGVVAH